MILPLQITFRNLHQSDAIDAKIRSYASKLDKFYQDIIDCRVIVESPKRHRQGNIYHVRIDLKLPGGELVVNRDPKEHGAHKDVYVAIHDAFDAARRQLQDYARRQHGEVKVKTPVPYGRISRLKIEEDYGFIEASDGRQIYFHRNSLPSNEFEKLTIGQTVQFAEEQGEKGPQASTVKLTRKHFA